MLPGYIILCLTACPFNLCLIFIIARSRHIRTVTNVLVASLATSDFLLSVLVVPPEMLHFIWSDFKPRGILCVLHQSVQVFIPLVSVAHLLAIAVERYIKIVHPLKYALTTKKSRVVLALLLIWLVPLIVSAFPGLGWNNLGTVNGTEMTNYVTMEITCMYLETMPCAYMSLIFFFVFLTLFTMATLYVRVFTIASYQARRIAATTMTVPNNTIFRTEIKALVVLVVTVGFFFLSWLPIAAVVLHGCIVGSELDRKWWLTSLFIAYLNSSINPLIYGIGNREIRRILFRRLRCKGTRQIHPDTLSTVAYIVPATETMKHRTESNL